MNAGPVMWHVLSSAPAGEQMASKCPICGAKHETDHERVRCKERRDANYAADPNVPTDDRDYRGGRHLSEGTVNAAPVARGGTSDNWRRDQPNLDDYWDR